MAVFHKSGPVKDSQDKNTKKVVGGDRRSYPCITEVIYKNRINVHGNKSKVVY